MRGRVCGRDDSTTEQGTAVDDSECESHDFKGESRCTVMGEGAVW